MYSTETPARPDLAVSRVRHPLKFRLAQVTHIVRLSPSLLRVTLGGHDLGDFHSASFDDHMKVFFPAPGELRPALPTLGSEGPVFAAGVARPTARDFTPRRYRAAEAATGAQLDVEFALHEAGPATEWAARAQVGHYLGIGGPRGSMIIPAYFDWHLLVGDDTALPAIARRLEELSDGVRAIVVAEVHDAAARIEFSSRAAVEVHWCHRADAAGMAGGSANAATGVTPLLAALRALPPLPSGEGYVWAAAESAVVRQIREHVSGDRGIAKERIRAAAYWKRGMQAVHEVIDE